MFKLNSVFKIVIIIFLSLVIPSFISIFKISFDEYVSAQKSDVKGASVVRVQTVDAKNTGGSSTEQNVIVDVTVPKSGSILNLSQRPFRFPTPQTTQIPVSAPVKNAPVSYAGGMPTYNFTEDNGRGAQGFMLTFLGVQGDRVAFFNGNDYDLNEVRIEIKWMDGNTEFTSVYATKKIDRKLYYYEDKNNTAEATIPLNPLRKVKRITVSFKDNKGASFTIQL